MIKSLASLYKYHIWVLIGLSISSILIIVKFRDPYIQFLTLTSLTIFYLVWALIFHYRDKSLKLEIVLEYVLTALLVLIVLYGVLI